MGSHQMLIDRALTLFRKLRHASTTATAWFSLFLSLVALATSIRSCEHAATSAEVAKLDFLSKQMLVLRLAKTGEHRSFEIVPLDFELSSSSGENLL